jgi:hypothetical protein
MTKLGEFLNEKMRKAIEEKTKKTKGQLKEKVAMPKGRRATKVKKSC